MRINKNDSTRKYLVEKMMDVLAEKYEHIDIMEIYLNDESQKCIRFLAHTYSSDGGYDDYGNWNEDFGYRVVYHSHQAEVLLSDYVTGVSENAFPDVTENYGIDDLMLEDDRQYIYDFTEEGFKDDLIQYIVSENILVYSSKIAMSENIPVGKYMFLLDVDSTTFLSEMVNKLDLDPSKKDEYVSELLAKIN